MAEDPSGIIEVPVIDKPCTTTVAHDRHRYLMDLDLDALRIYDCPGIAVHEDQHKAPIIVSRPAEQWVAVNAAMMAFYYDCKSGGRGENMKRITGEFEEINTNGLTWDDVAYDQH